MRRRRPKATSAPQPPKPRWCWWCGRPWWPPCSCVLCMMYHDISLLSVLSRRREGHDLDDVAGGVAHEAARGAPVLLARLGVEAGLAQAGERRLVVVGDDGEVRARGD